MASLMKLTIIPEMEGKASLVKDHLSFLHLDILIEK